MVTAQGHRTRTPKEIEDNLAALREVAISWVCGAMLLAAWAYIGNAWPYISLVYAGVGLTYVAIIYAAMRRGYTERFADPTLTFPQLVIALSNHCFCLWLAPEAAIYFLISIFQTCAYGLFSLTGRQFRMLLYIVAVESFLALVLSQSRLTVPVAGLPGALLLFLTFILAFDRFVRVAGYVSSLRKRVSAKNLELTDSEARFRALTELSSDWYWELDAEMRFTRLESGRDSDVLPQKLLLGQQLWESEFIPEPNDNWEALRATVDSRAHFRNVVIRRVSPGRKEYFVSISGGPINTHGHFKGYRGVAREVTDEKLAEERIQYIATHDGLTGLPNRLMFNELLTMLIQSSQRYSRHFAVLFVDLDRFKLINDTLGHDVGDSLLKEISSRFKQALRTSDIVIRLGGDEFVVLIPEIENQEEVATVARKLLAAAVRPMVLAGQECQVSASVGIAMYPDHGEDEQTLLKNADSAMYLAKEEGKNNFQFYSKSIGARTMGALPAEASQRQALDRHEN